MNFLIVLALSLFSQPYLGSGYSDYAPMKDRIKICQRVTGVGTDTNYVLQCLKRAELTEIQEKEDQMQLFFADASIINELASNDAYLYIHVLSDIRNPSTASRTCYRVVFEIDEARDGYYAVEVCEYN